MSVLLETTLGDIVIDLFTDERPRASLNFLKLCKIKYYNFCLFHFVQRNFTAQTGDPTGTGKGGESVFRHLYGEQAKFFEAEVKPRLKHINKGTVSMVNNGDNMHGSQFFFTLADNLDYLDGIHTVFGEVSEGMEILEKINEAICDDTNRPYQDIRISHTVILDDPFDDPPELVIPDRSPEPTKEQLESSRIGADEKIDDTEGKTTGEIEEMIADKEEKAGAQVLEMIGDIPDADIKPPENVLFVCKLNPVTTDEDLEIIFSRFGTITSCEIVRDQKSGESLQYAFIEFEKEEDCERAYFKMDNVLIDDRRIHVDFSQSVAHIKWTKQGAKPVYTEKKESQPKYTIKEKARKDKYDLVFDESESSDEEKRKKDKSEKKDKEKRTKQDRKREHKDKSRRDSSSEDDGRKRRHKERRKEDRHDRESYDKKRCCHDDDSDDDRRQKGRDKEGSYHRREDEKRRERSRTESYHRHSSGEKKQSSSQEHDRRYRERESEKARHRHR